MRCGSGSWGGWCLSMGDYVTGRGARGGPPLPEGVDVDYPLVDVNANMVHGWPLLSAAMTACSSCGAVYATTLSERPAAS